MTAASGPARWSLSPEVAFLDHGERIIALGLRYPARARPLLLSGPSAEIWRLAAAGGSTAEIASALAQRYQSAGLDVMTDVLQVLEHFRAEGLMERQGPS